MHLWEQFNRSGQGWSASDQDGTLCLLDHRPDELCPLGAVRLQGVALITNDNAKAAEQRRMLLSM